MANLTVKGKIEDAQKTPLPNLIVRAYDIDLRRRELLGETTTDRKGEYAISYTTAQFVRAEKDRADMLLEVLDTHGNSIGQSEVLFHAADGAIINMAIAPEKYTPPADFDAIAAAIAPLLVRSGITIAALEENETHRDLTFMAGETGLDKTQLASFVLAHRLSATSGLSAELWYAALVYKAILSANEQEALTLQTERILADIPKVDAEAFRRALEKGVKDNRIAATFSMEEAVMQFKKIAVEQMNRLDTAVKNILLVAKVAKSKHADFAALFLENRVFDADFKQRLAADARFTEKEKANLETTFRLAELTANDVQVMQKLKTLVGSKGENGIRQLARQSQAEWEQLLLNTNVKSISGDNSNQDSLAPLDPAASIARSFAAAYPTTAFAEALDRDLAATKQRPSRQTAKNKESEATKKDALDILPNVLNFLNNNDDFDLLGGDIDTFFEQNVAGKAAGSRSLLPQADPDQLKNELKTVQRVFRLQPTFEATKSLLEKDLHSAQKIYGLGEQAFVREVKDSPGFTEQTARSTFQKAANTHAAVLTMVAEWRDVHDAQMIAALQTPSASSTATGERALVPNWQTLFGSTDVCECEHCRSVFSASAYLMDTIAFLKARPLKYSPASSAWDVLKKRRPDIGFLEMSCDNTNVPLPYIDIVCEILEEELAFGKTSLRLGDAAWAFKLPIASEANLIKGLAPTALKADFLAKNFPLSASAVVSEKQTLTDRDRYDCWIIRDAQASFKVVKRPLRNDLAVALLRQTRDTEAWLAATPQYVNAKVYFPGELSTAAYPMNLPFNPFQEETQALMSNVGVKRWDIVETIHPNVWNSYTASEYFGFNTSFWTATPASQFQFWGEPDNVALVANASNVNIFLNKIGLEYADLLSLLDLKWVNPTGNIYIEHLDTSCDTAKKIIRNTDPAVFDRILKLTRLSKRSGWELWETDLVLRHPRLGNGALTQNTLIPIWIFAELAKQLHLTVDKALVLLGDINTGTRFSEAYAPRIEGLYQTIFLNPRNAPSAAFEVAQVTAAAPVALIADHKKALQTALTLTEEELEALLQLKRPDGTAFLAANAALSLSNISFLYRNVLLYRGFNMPSALAWATFVRFMGYMALDNAPSSSVYTWLSRESIATINQAVDFYNAGLLEIPELEYIARNDRSTAAAPKEAEIVTILSGIMKTGKTLTDDDRSTFVVQQLSEKLDLSLPLTQCILTELWFGTVKGGAITPFLNKNQITPVTVANFANGLNSYHWLKRVSLLIKKLNISVKELQVLNDLQTTDSFMAQLLFAPLAQTKTLQVLSNFKNILDFNRSYTNEKLSFFDIQVKLKTTPYTNAAAFALDVAVLFNCKVVDVAFLVTDWNGFLPFPNTYYLNAVMWQRLEKTLAFIRKLNVSAAQLKTLSDNNGNYLNDANLLKQSLRPLYAEKQWLDVLKTIQDNLRERKREALVAFLLTQPPPANLPSGKWENANDLYAYYLMDVEMTSAQPTSRIVQAAGSIQLFVQRCLMGLEPEIVVDTEGADADMGWQQWQWMKNYRVWEANRKVFLYPENWIEPELRRNKSPFFKEFENELSQNELTRDNVETVFLNYLEKLEGVANLEPMGHCWQEETDTFHVFARTQGTPHTYYYRQFMESRRWTAWTKVELDIQNDYLVPFIRNGRLYLFWMQITETPLETGSSTAPVPKEGGGNYPMQHPQKQINLQLAYSRLTNGKWAAKKVSKNAVAGGVYNTSMNTKQGFVIVPFNSSHVNLMAEDNTPSFLVACYAGGGFSVPLGIFEIDGCKGIPEARLTAGNASFNPDVINKLPFIADTVFNNMKANGKNINGPLVLRDAERNTVPLLGKTGYSTFGISQAWQPTIIDAVYKRKGPNIADLYSGNFMPYFFYNSQSTFWAYRKKVNPKLNTEIGVKAIGQIFRSESFYLDEVIKLNEQLNTGKIDKLEYEKELKKLNEKRNSNLETYASAFSITSFFSFYHPLVCFFTNKIYNEGIDGMMKRSTQLMDKGFDFYNTYSPTSAVGNRYPRENVDFTPDGSYSIYNWELFFHAPLMIAMRLAKNQKFEEAIHWFHYIFNPLDPTPLDPSNPARKYWVTKPFFERQKKEYDYQSIDVLLKKLAGDPSVPVDDTSIAPLFTRQEIESQVSDWRKHPFEPHTIAEYRTVAYQKTVIMKYLDTLIAWGDQLYRRDTMESINEATQLYVMAAEILGARPRRVPPAYKALPETFNELEAKMDKFSNGLITGLENLVPAVPSTAVSGPVPSLPNVLYFCLPQNDKLLSYWDTVANRLYNIRHGLNIEGVKRSLALFAPAIDPATMVRAVAGGADIGSALPDMAAPLPFYRFSVALQKANELCNDVKGLGGALLSALEKKDGEALSLLRQTHELAVLEAIRSIKTMQIEDATLSLDGLKKNKEMITLRRNYYASREYMNAGEGVALGLNIASTVLDAAIAVGYTLSGGLKLIPEFDLGVAGFGASPTVKVKTGGHSFGNSAEDAVKTISAISHALDKGAGIANTLASYQRRMEDWQHQTQLADKELEQIEKSIASAELKIRLAERELRNHDLQVNNARSVDEYMQTKYTNKELYEWQISQISQIYFQTYQLAFDWSKKAEKCYRFELGITDNSIPSLVQFGHWDSLKKGLMSGEKLQLDLRRLEAVYMESNKREFELTKHISLALLHPSALMQLREKGICQFELPETIFDLDYQGHYFRRIKSVSLSIPCIAGPYTTINGTLRLMNNSVRFNNSATPQYPSRGTGEDRFMENPVGIKNVAMSSAQNDNGMFDFNFRDERYLPFEGAGVISTWVLELTTERSLRQFDYNTISDAILHLRYTAKEDGALKTASTTYLKTLIDNTASNNTPFRRLFSLRHEFPTAWHRFLHPEAGQENICILDMIQTRFPFFAQGKQMAIRSAEFHIKAKNADVFVMQFAPPLTVSTPFTSAIASATTGLQAITITNALPLADAQNPATFWQLKLKKSAANNFNSLTKNDVEDVFLLIEYTLQSI